MISHPRCKATAATDSGLLDWMGSAGQRYRSLCLAGVLVPLLFGGTVAPAETVRVDSEAAAQRVLEVSALSAAATARSAAARAAVAAADAAVRPTVGLSAFLMQRSSVPEFIMPDPSGLGPPTVLYPNIPTTYGTSIQLQQLIYSGGAVTAARSAARSELDLSRAGEAQTAADLRLMARTTTWDAVRADASLLVARANEERARRVVSDTRALRDAGMGVRADVLSAEERLASSRLWVVRALNLVAGSRAALRSLLNLPADADIVLADTLEEALPPRPEPLESLQDVARRSRPELQALDARLAALAQREEMARAALRPNVGLAAGWDGARPHQRYFPLKDTWNDAWSVGVTASWRLYDGGRASADEAQVSAQQEALVREIEELRRLIDLEVETARLGLESALAEVDAAEAARVSAVERQRAVRERHQAGLATMSEVLDAEAALAAAAQSQVDARAASYLAQARLARALGQ